MSHPITICRHLLIAGCLLLFWSLLSESARAQNSPTVSPYLNLLYTDDFGNQTSYQTLVRPMIQQRAMAQANQADITRLQSQVRGVQGAVRSGRGRGGGGGGAGGAATYMNYSHYYTGIRR